MELKLHYLQISYNSIYDLRYLYYLIANTFNTFFIDRIGVHNNTMIAIWKTSHMHHVYTDSLEHINGNLVIILTHIV